MTVSALLHARPKADQLLSAQSCPSGRGTQVRSWRILAVGASSQLKGRNPPFADLSVGVPEVPCSARD